MTKPFIFSIIAGNFGGVGMDKERVLRDVSNACSVVDSGSLGYHFFRIYYTSNEDLPSLFQNFSVKDKDVLTVLGSSDQYFYSYYYGARRVDTYDINNLTKYYYYLRMWCLKYHSSFYPDRKEFLKSTKFLGELLEKVECSSEEEETAYFFWNQYIHRVYPFDHSNLFHVTHNDDIALPPHEVFDCVKDKEFTFYHGNICREITIGKKYDVILTSNILEYCSDNEFVLKKSRDNLKGLLNDNGIVVCSHITEECNPLESSIFRKDFERSEFGMVRDKLFPTYYTSVGYVYQKK